MYAKYLVFINLSITGIPGIGPSVFRVFFKANSVFQNVYFRGVFSVFQKIPFFQIFLSRFLGGGSIFTSKFPFFRF